MIAETLHRIEAATSGLAKTFIGLGVAIAGTFTAVAAGTISMIQHVAESDQQFRLLGLRMRMSTENAKGMQRALDALGVSLEDAFWDPELRDRFNEFFAAEEKMQKNLGAHFGENMRDIRELDALMKRFFGLDIPYLKDATVGALARMLKDAGLYDKFKEFIDLVENNTGVAGERIAKVLYPILRDTAIAIKDITSSFIKLIGIISGDERLKDGEITVEKIGFALDDVAKTISKLVGYVETFAGWLKKIKDEVQPILDWIEKHPEMAAVLGIGGYATLKAGGAFLGGGGLLGGLGTALGKAALGGGAEAALGGGAEELGAAIAVGLGGPAALIALGTIISVALVAAVTAYLKSQATPEEEAQHKTDVDEQRALWNKVVGAFTTGTPVPEDPAITAKMWKPFSETWDETKQQVRGWGDWWKQTIGETKQQGGLGPIGDWQGIQDLTKNWTKTNIVNAIKDMAGQKGIDVPPELALSVARRESAFNPTALGPATRSGEHAYGIMQLMGGTAEQMGVDRMDVLGNITGGLKYLRKMYDQFHDWKLALMAYNWGPGNVERWIRGGQTGAVPKETQEYIKNILSNTANIGGINVYGAPGQNPNDIAQALWDKVDEQMNKKTQRMSAQLSGVHG